MTTATRPLLTAEELAAHWKVSKTHIYNMARQTGPDRLPAVRFGRTLRFDQDAVDRWMSDHGDRKKGR